MVNAVLAGVIAYVALQFAIGVWVSRRIKTETDYILAGRQLGTTLAAVSVFATWFGAETVLGSAGRVYSDGLSGAQGEPFAYAVGIIIMGLVFAARLWRRGLTTFADLFRQRFSPGVEWLTVLLLVPGSVLWAAAQIRGFGQVVSATSDFNLYAAMTMAAVVVIVYTIFGGLLADVYTDLVQGIAIVVGLVLTFIVVAQQVGGVGAGLAGVEPARFNARADGQGWLAFIEQWAIPICGSLVAVELISRVLACRSADVARLATTLGGLLYFFVALIPVFFGLVAIKLLAKPVEPEQMVLEVVRTHLPTILYVAFAGALISAILSSVDSALLASASLVSHNLVQHVHPDFPEQGKVAITRVCVAGLGLVAYVIALRSASISSLVEQASAFATAGIFVAFAFGIMTSFGGPLAAYAAILVGGAVWLVGSKEHGLAITAPYVAGLAAATVSYVVVGLVEGSTRSTAEVSRA